METTSVEIADGIHRISTFIPEAGIPFNQYLVVAEEPLLFHTGHRQMFPLVAAAVGRIMPVESLRWITFGHVEADECGSMNRWLEAAPQAQVAHGMTAVMVSLNDLADRPPRALGDGEVVDLGGKRVRWIDTPHVPHGWEAGLLFEETTATLFAGDLFTATGDGPAVTDDDIVEPAISGEEMFHATALTPMTAPTIRRLAELDVAALALMHGPAFTGDGRGRSSDWPATTRRPWTQHGRARPSSDPDQLAAPIVLNPARPGLRRPAHRWGWDTESCPTARAHG